MHNFQKLNDNQDFSLKRLFLSKIPTVDIFSKKSPNLFQSFPKKIGDYRFVKTIMNERTDRPFQFAQYVSKVGNEAIAKRWTGRKKNFDYYSLVNEMKIYKELDTLYKTHGREIVKKYPDIKIPRIIDVQKDKGMAMLVIEMIQYGPINSIDVREKIKIYQRAIEYLRFIGGLISKNKTSTIAKRSLASTILISPFISIKAIIQSPKTLGDVLKGLIILLSTTPLLLKENKVSLLHKSLEDFNILSDGKKISLVDFQLSVLEHPVYELAQIVLFSWHDKSFVNEFYFSKIMQRIFSKKTSFSVYKALCIYSGIMELAFGSKAEFNRNYSFLKHGISLRENRTKIITDRNYSQIEKKNFNKTLSVGIPVYNETNNIEFLLKSVLAQRQETYKLEKIIIVCDGSSDGTDRKALEMKKKFPIINVINHKSRKGKKSRLTEIFQKNKSDYLIILDGDIALSNEQVFEHMLGYFDEKDVAIVGGNYQPAEAENTLQRLINTWEHLWYFARHRTNGGDTVHNFSGCAMTLNASFAKTITFPKEILRDAPYIYFEALRKKLRFRFADDAIILFRKPSNLRDLIIQNNRYTQERQKLAMIFGETINEHYKIPITNKLNALGFMLITSPIETLFSGFFYFYLNFIKNLSKTSYKKSDKWEIATTTKSPIHV